MTDPSAHRRIMRVRRHRRIRKNLTGSGVRPRLSVFRSSKHISAQLIDDTRGVTIASASTLEGDMRKKGGGNVDAAEKVGGLIAERAKAQGITQVVFDRGGYRYHGRVAALADAARTAGLEF